MHVKARMTAFSGLLLALSVVCMALGSVIETNTLFLLAAASYFVGIIIREFGMKAGVAFYLEYMVFNLMYIPMVLIFQELLFMKELSGGLLLAVLAAGQVGVWIYDRAYEYVQVHIWNKFRGKLLN